MATFSTATVHVLFALLLSLHVYFTFLRQPAANVMQDTISQEIHVISVLHLVVWTVSPQQLALSVLLATFSPRVAVFAAIPLLQVAASVLTRQYVLSVTLPFILIPLCSALPVCLNFPPALSALTLPTALLAQLVTTLKVALAQVALQSLAALCAKAPQSAKIVWKDIINWMALAFLAKVFDRIAPSARILQYV